MTKDERSAIAFVFHLWSFVLGRVYDYAKTTTLRLGLPAQARSAGAADEACDGRRNARRAPQPAPRQLGRVRRLPPICRRRRYPPDRLEPVRADGSLLPQADGGRGGADDSPAGGQHRLDGLG